MASAAASAGGGGAIRAGRAFVELFADNAPLLRGLEQAKRKFEGWAAGLSRAGIKIGAIGAAISTPILSAFRDVVNRGAAIHDMAERFNITTESVSALAFAFERGGVGLDEFGGILDGLNSKVVAAADANTELIQGLQGLNGRALIGKGIDEQLDLIAEKFTQIKLAADQSDVANGLGLRALLPWLKKGKGGLDELKKAAKQAGAVLGLKEAKESKAVAEGYTKIWQEVKYTLLALGESLLPTAAGMTDFGERVAKALRAVREWVQENRGVIQSVAILGGSLIAGAAAAAVFSAALSAVALVIGLVVGALKLVLVAVLALLTPLGLVAAAVIAMGASWITGSENGKKAAGELRDAWTEVGNTFQEAWTGIASAIRRGDLQTAFQIAALTIKKTWNEMIAAMGRSFAAFVKDNHDSIVGLAMLVGAYKGEVLGAGAGDAVGQFLGPTGKLVAGVGGRVGGAIAGGAGGAYAGRELSHALQKLGNVEAFDKRAKDAADELRKVLEEEKAAAEAFAADQMRIRKEKPGDQPQAAPQKPADPAAILAEEMRRRLGGGDLAGKLFAAQKGIFSGPAQLQLGYGDNTAKRQLDAVIDIGKKAAALPEIDKKMGDLTNALRFA